MKISSNIKIAEYLRQNEQTKSMTWLVAEEHPYSKTKNKKGHSDWSVNICINVTNATPAYFAIASLPTILQPQMTWLLTFCPILHVPTVWSMFHYFLNFGQVQRLNGLSVSSKIFKYWQIHCLYGLLQNFHFWLVILIFLFQGVGLEVELGSGWRWVVGVNERPWLGCFMLFPLGTVGGLCSVGSSSFVLFPFKRNACTVKPVCNDHLISWVIWDNSVTVVR